MNKRVYVGLEHRFYNYQGELYSKLAFSYPYWKDYLSFFDEVVIVARVKKVEEWDDRFVIVSGESVTFRALPHYLGVKDFILSLSSLLSKSREIVKEGDNFILRTGNVSSLLWLWIVLSRKKYLREYPGNVYEGVVGFSGGSFPYKILGYFLHKFAGFQARQSCANSFVSESCKKLYESNKASYIFSSFNSDEINYTKNNKTGIGEKNIVSVGRLEGEKGHVDLLASLSRTKVNIVAHIIGDGSQADNLKKFAKENKLNVKFYGAITEREYLFKLLSEMDAFILPSHTEGMPRSLLEAMAIGLPCIGTNVGGIPEVLDKKFLFEVKNIEQCSALLDLVLSDEKLMSNMSNRNKNYITKNYSNQALQEKRIAFWSELYK
ncbi:MULTISPECIES: glycosyltransferase family 4 protein [unclassified Pseudoalteromonas]|uniref:glycosyltransferase family 4 protein n=1 Tax=unclassified Pseudoalteromonas TaxID=194690 RepID=UPI00235A284B|nr:MULTISPECIES: glycosyltransferase family 4 protein [unclassified Pseudoalteromonas]MDC9498772.1 glycosyltransferase family 4 protein [Pseudoalteromonas sp. Angola-20]MDC9518585.1 glycosyltransferase family 4 protein [Pseudoalteromonas sp. Angola-22]MDC9534992.1 glycosyltransferase family 4 protein [Pseudoalteromonas sp. Angola-9]